MSSTLWYQYPINWRSHCVKSVQIRSFFWSVFSRIRTEYGETLIHLVRTWILLKISFFCYWKSVLLKNSFIKVCVSGGLVFWKILRTYQMNDPVYVFHGIFRDVQNNCFLAPLSTVDSVQLKIYTFFWRSSEFMKTRS